MTEKPFQSSLGTPGVQNHNQIQTSTPSLSQTPESLQILQSFQKIPGLFPGQGVSLIHVRPGQLVAASKPSAAALTGRRT